MKACIISLTILIALLGISCLNALYIGGVCSKLIELEESFPNKEDDEEKPPDPQIEKARELLEKSYETIALTCHTEIPNAIVLALEHVYSFYLHGSRADYLAARADFVSAVKALEKSERISICNIV